MKTKLLKKVRARFKVIHNQITKQNRWTITPFALVYDRKGTEPKEEDYKCYYRLDNQISSISSPTLAERLVIKIMGMTYVVKHRKLIDKRKNKSMNIKLDSMINE